MLTAAQARRVDRSSDQDFRAAPLQDGEQRRRGAKDIDDHRDLPLQHPGFFGEKRDIELHPRALELFVIWRGGQYLGQAGPKLFGHSLRGPPGERRVLRSHLEQRRLAADHLPPI